MNYFGASINQSATLLETAGTAITDGVFLAAKYDANGNVAVNDAEGGVIAGIILPETSNVVPQGADVTIQIKDIGYGKSGAALVKGIEVMADAQGRLIPAAAGKFIVGFALQSAAAADEVILVDIRKCGYKAASV